MKKKRLPLIGTLLILAGIGGIFWTVTHPSVSNFDDLVDESVVYFAKMNLNTQTYDFLSEKTDITRKIIEPQLSESFGVHVSDLSPWIGSQIAIAQFHDGSFLAGAKFRNRKKAEDFVELFTVENEEIQKRETPYGDIFTPAFSSSITFLFSGRWLIMADSGQTLERNITTTTPLSGSEQYQSIIRDLSPRRTMIAYIDNTELVQFAEKKPQHRSILPILRGLEQSIPSAGISVLMQDDQTHVRLKITSDEKLFPKSKTKRSNNPLPKLAEYAAFDSLAFISGLDIHDKYITTKEFLTDLDPDLALIFDGIIRAQAKNIFGANIDFEKDILERLQGEYALVLDYETDQTMTTSFLSGFDGSDTQTNQKTIEEILLNAQQGFTSTIKEVELPDGTTREELISIPSDKITPKQKTYGDLSYFLFEAGNTNPNKVLTYGFSEGNALVSSDESGYLSMLGAKAQTTPNLLFNGAFRETVINELPVSLSYGFLHVPKLITALSSAFDEETIQSLDTLLPFKSIIFSRNIHPREIFWDIILLP